MPKLYLLLCLSLWACQPPAPASPSPSNNPTVSPGTVPTPTATPLPTATPSPPAIPTPSSDPAGFALGETFSLKLNQEKAAAAETLNVKFLAVPEDSRCPSDVTCVWAGQVKVTLSMSTKQHAAEDKEILFSGASESAEISWKEYKIELLAVDPYPKSQSAKSEYVVKLRISRL